MAPIREAVEQYLKQVGALKPVGLGPADTQVGAAASPEDTEALVSSLREAAKLNNTILVAIVILHFLIFVLAAWMAYYYRGQPHTIYLLLGGSIASPITITQGLSRLWERKCIIDIIVNVAPRLPPPDVVKLVQGVYFNKLAK